MPAQQTPGMVVYPKTEGEAEGMRFRMRGEPPELNYNAETTEGLSLPKARSLEKYKTGWKGGERNRNEKEREQEIAEQRIRERDANNNLYTQGPSGTGRQRSGKEIDGREGNHNPVSSKGGGETSLRNSAKDVRRPVGRKEYSRKGVITADERRHRKRSHQNTWTRKFTDAKRPRRETHWQDYKTERPVTGRCAGVLQSEGLLREETYRRKKPGR